MLCEWNKAYSDTSTACSQHCGTPVRTTLEYAVAEPEVHGLWSMLSIMMMAIHLQKNHNSMYSCIFALHMMTSLQLLAPSVIRQCPIYRVTIIAFPSKHGLRMATMAIQAEERYLHLQIKKSYHVLIARILAIWASTTADHPVDQRIMTFKGWTALSFNMAMKDMLEGTSWL